MKQKLLTVAVAILLSLSSCINYEAEINDLSHKINESEQSLVDLERRVAALENQVYIVNKEQLDNGYKITFSDGSVIEIVNGVNGKDGVDGTNGVDGVSVTNIERVGDQIIFYMSDNTQFSIDAPKDGVDGTDGTDGISVVNIEMEGNIMIFTMSDGTTYRLAINQTVIDDIINDQLETPGPGSYLVSDDPDAVASFKWTASSAGAVNISAPIYMSAVESGSSMQKTATIALRDLENKLALPLNDLEFIDATRLRAWDLAGVLFAYEKTGDEKYLVLADRVWPIHKILYEIPRGGSVDYFGFDMYGALKGITLMVKHSTTYKTEAEAVLVIQTQHLLDNDDIAVASGASTWSNWAYYALIKKEFGIGDYTIAQCYTNFYANQDTFFASADYVQEVSYGALVFSDLAEFDLPANLSYINNAIENEITVSEVLVEALHANYVLMNK